MRTRSLLLAFIVATTVPGCAFLGRASVSSGPDHTQTSVTSSHPSISGSGRYVAFASSDAHLVAGDTNGTSDVFVHDNVTDITERVSTTPANLESGGVSTQPSISDDGRFVAFTTTATDLVADGNDGTNTDVFVKDRTTGNVSLVSVRDGEGGADQPINEPASDPVISGDGNSVAFQISATRLIPDGPPLPPLAFGPFVRHLNAGTTVLMAGTSLQSYVIVMTYDLSDDGTVVVYHEVNVVGLIGATHVGNGTTGAIVGDIESHSVSPAGPFPPAVVAVSGNGARFAAIANPITGNATLRWGSTTDPTHPAETSTLPVSKALFLSTDGAILGWQTTLVAGPIAIVRSLPDPATKIVTRTRDGGRIVNGSEIAMSANGKWFTFVSGDDQLVLNDTNGVGDVFTRSVDEHFPIPTPA